MWDVGFLLMALTKGKQFFNGLPAEGKHSGRCLHRCSHFSNTFSRCGCVCVPQNHTTASVQKSLKIYVLYESLCLCWFYSSCYYQQVILPSTNTLTPSLLDLHHDRYSPDTDSWSTDVAPLSSPRSGVCLVAMDGYLYAIGGHDGITAMNTVERY